MEKKDKGDIMGKKKYIKPEIREESHILTVNAFVTATQYFLAQPTTNTSVSLQRALNRVTRTSQAQQQRVTNSSYFVQRRLARVFG